MSEESPAYAAGTQHTYSTCAPSTQTTLVLLVSKEMKWYIAVFINSIGGLAGW